MNTYKLTQEERFSLVMECRQSGMTDYQWCEEHGISTNTMYRWIRKFSSNGYPNVPAANKSGSAITAVPQQAVKLNVVPETGLDTGFFSPTDSCADVAVEIIRGDTLIKINNHANPQVIDQILRHLGGSQ